MFTHISYKDTDHFNTSLQISYELTLMFAFSADQSPQR